MLMGYSGPETPKHQLFEWAALFVIFCHISF